MAIIEEFFATQQVEVARVPRASQNIVAAGQGIVAQQIVQTAGQVGQAVVDVATVDFQKQQSRDRVTLAQLRGQWEDFVFLSTPDPTKWKTIEDGQRQQVRFEKDLQRKGDFLSHGQSLGVQQDFKVYTELNRVNAKARYARKRIPAERAWALSQIQTQWASRLKNNAGDTEKTEQELISLIDDFSPYLTPAQTSSLKNDVSKSVELYTKQVQLDGLHETAKAMEFDQAIGMLNDIKGLTSAERNDLIARRKRQNEIETASESKGNSTYWKLLRQVTNDPDSVTEPEIAKEVRPNGITTAQYEHLMGKKEDDSEPLKTPRAQLYFNSLDALFPDRETEDDDRLTYDIYNQKLERFFTDNPKATPQQAADFYNELVNPEVVSWTDKIFDKLFKGSEGTGAAPLFGGGFPTQKPKTATPISNRITVEKDGKRFTIPQEQLAEAEKQGYTRTE
jgi:hypothetical protein